MTQNIPLFHRGNVARIYVQITTTNRRRGNFNDRIAVIFYFWIGYINLPARRRHHASTKLFIVYNLHCFLCTSGFTKCHCFFSFKFRKAVAISRSGDVRFQEHIGVMMVLKMKNWFCPFGLAYR